MAVYKPRDLEALPRHDYLSLDKLRETFSSLAINASRTNNKLRLMNSKPEVATLPALYPYNQKLLITLQSLYYNVSTFKSDKHTGNRKLEVDFSITEKPLTCKEAHKFIEHLSDASDYLPELPLFNPKDNSNG